MSAYFDIAYGLEVCPLTRTDYLSVDFVVIRNYSVPQTVTLSTNAERVLSSVYRAK